MYFYARHFTGQIKRTYDLERTHGLAEQYWGLGFHSQLPLVVLTKEEDTFKHIKKKSSFIYVYVCVHMCVVCIAIKAYVEVMVCMCIYVCKGGTYVCSMYMYVYICVCGMYKPQKLV